MLTISGDQDIIADFKEQPLWHSLAMIRGMNRGMTAAKTLMARSIAQDTGLKVSDVKDALPISDADVSRPRARLAASLKRISLIKFNARGPEPSRGQGRGVTARLKGGAGRYPHAFIATMASGHRGVYERVAGGSRTKSVGAWSKNLPIKEKYGPSLGRVFGKFRQAGVDRAMEVFQTTFDHELERRKPATVTVTETNA